MIPVDHLAPLEPADTAPLRPPFPYQAALFALVVGTIGALSAIYCTQPILPQLSADFQVDAPTAGLTLSLMTAALAVALLIYGPLSDQVGRRPVLIGCCLGMAVPSLGAMLAPTFSWLLLCRLGQGVLAGGISAVALAYIADEFPGERIGLAVGTYTAAMVAAALVGRVGGGLLTAWLSWRVMFGVFGGLAVIGAGLFATLLPPSRRFQRSGTLRTAYAGGGVHWRNPRMLGIFAVGFALLFSFMGFFTYLSYHLAGPPFRLPLYALTLIYGVYAMGVVGPFAGNLSTRVGRRPVLVAGLIILTAGLLLTLAASLPVVIAGCVVLALGMFSAQSVANAYVSDQARQARGAASGFYLFCYYAGGTLGIQLTGMLWNAWGWPAVVAACVAVALAAAAVAARFCRDTRPAPTTTPDAPV
jgi:YNFM family putative membrane transporter